MSSPFPGMDPYLERHWGDVHQSLITYIRDAIQSRLPGHLRARMEERVYVQTLDQMRSEYIPDVHVAERPRREPGGGTATAIMEETVVLAEPLMFVISEDVREGYVDIVDTRSGYRVITSIEVVSPTNKKPGEGRELYRQKQRDMRAADVNLLEIDLLRVGERVTMFRIEPTVLIQNIAYMTTIWRPTRLNALAVYPMSIRERLPVVPVPLGPGDPLVPLNLQALIDLSYRNGGYDDIDYRVEPDPTLGREDAEWADRLLRERGRR